MTCTESLLVKLLMLVARHSMLWLLASNTIGKHAGVDENLNKA